MAQWISRWSTEPEILGSIPSGVPTHPQYAFLFFYYLSPTARLQGPAFSFLAPTASAASAQWQQTWLLLFTCSWRTHNLWSLKFGVFSCRDQAPGTMVLESSPPAYQLQNCGCSYLEWFNFKETSTLALFRTEPAFSPNIPEADCRRN